MTGTETSGVPVIAIEGLTVQYGQVTVIDKVNLSIPRGLVYALLGRNGSGKTSTVRCLLGQQKPTSGTVLLFGEDAWHHRARAMARTGVVPEIPDIPPEMTTTQVESFCRSLHPRWARDIYVGLIERFEAPQRISYSRLSKGEKRLVSLAVALGTSPELLVLDDPTLGLDVVVRKVLFEELIGELADRNTTVFVTTHDLAGIEGIADRFGILHGGKLVLDEASDALKQRFRGLRWPHSADESAETIRTILQPMGLIHTKATEFGHEATVTDYDEAALHRLREIVGTVNVKSLSLEEIFVALCGEVVQ